MHRNVFWGQLFCFLSRLSGPNIFTRTKHVYLAKIFWPRLFVWLTLRSYWRISFFCLSQTKMLYYLGKKAGPDKLFFWTFLKYGLIREIWAIVNKRINILMVQPLKNWIVIIMLQCMPIEILILVSKITSFLILFKILVMIGKVIENQS